MNELTKTLYNILKKHNPNCIEILLGIDKDDISSINFEFYNLINKIKIKIILERRGGGPTLRLKEMVKSLIRIFIHFADDMILLIIIGTKYSGCNKQPVCR